MRNMKTSVNVFIFMNKIHKNESLFFELKSLLSLEYKYSSISY